MRPQSLLRTTMSNARFWYVPLKDIALAEQRAQLAAMEDVRASDLPASFNVPSKLYGEGIRAGHVLALHDGDTVTALARVLALDSAGTLHWRRLPMLEAPELSATPELREVTGTEAQQFKLGIDAVLRDVPGSAGPIPAPTAPTTVYTPIDAPSNVILHGPPGTGKTHSVRRRALELIGDASAASASDAEVNSQWAQLRRDGQIVFCTFHQAFAYEEFVEGLRANTDDKGNVQYRVEPGVFKRLALAAAAEGISSDAEDSDFDDLWEALVESLREEPRIIESSTRRKYQMEPAARGGVYFRGGTLDDDEVFEPNGKWLIANERSMRALWEKRAHLGESPKTTDIGPLAKGHITAMWIVYRELLRLQKASRRSPDPVARAQRALASGRNFHFAEGVRHYVLVIDEINRANIARVFGELMTLLESDKRLGSANELRVQLPASKEWFGVPPNLHVVGTMNTADRSIALMDIALRRRFTFEEMMPDVEVLSSKLPDSEVKDLTIKVFEKLNERLCYLYDREHQIGHAWFLDVKSIEDLRGVFATKIIPLLQEYFFGRWEKVALALGHPRKNDEWDTSVEHTVLRVREVTEKAVLGFDHDDYEESQLQWEVRDAFLPRPKVAAESAWLQKTLTLLAQKIKVG
jgi:5-methylcytosine-specific restriction protein B